MTGCVCRALGGLSALIDKILTSFNMVDCNPISTPMESSLVLSRQTDTLTRQEELDLLDLPYQRLVGLLMYLAIATHPDIAFAICKLSQFMNYYCTVHWNAAKRVVRYLKSTRTLRLHLGGLNPTKLVGFTDASYACCPDSSKSIGAYCFSLSDSVISWASQKQKTVAQSTCDAEYIACSKAACECMWLQMLTDEIRILQPHPTPLLTDNEVALALAKDPCFHARAKHINTHYHYIHECIDNLNIYLSYVITTDNVADILTKPLSPCPGFPPSALPPWTLQSALGFPLKEEIFRVLVLFPSWSVSLVLPFFLSFHYTSTVISVIVFFLLITLPILRLRRSFGNYNQCLDLVIESCDSAYTYPYIHVLPPSVVL